MSNFSIKKNDIMYIFAIFFILAIIYYIFYKEGFENNYNNPYNLSSIRSKTIKNNNIVECNYFETDKSTIILDNVLDIPNLYLHTADCHSCHVDEKMRPIREQRMKQIINVTNILQKYMGNLIYCNENIVSSYKSCIKNLLMHVVSNNAYLKTNKNNSESLMYLNFSFLPFICQGYLLTSDAFNNNEKTLFKKYIYNIYDLIEDEMMSKKNNWKFGFGRCCLLCGIIIDNQKIYNQGLDILKYTFSTVDNDGFMKTEMDRGHRSTIYNFKSACFLFDMINFANKSLSKNEKDKVYDIANNLVNSYIYDNDPNNKTKSKYQQKTKVEQQPLNLDAIFKILNYEFVINNLNKENKQFITSKIDIKQIYNPLSMGN